MKHNQLSRMNQSMMDLYRNIRTSVQNPKRPLQPPLASLLAAGIVEQDSCLLLAALVNINTNATKHSFPDLTGYECFLNHLHVSDYVDSGEVLIQGLKFGFQLAKQLRPFSSSSTVILSADPASEDVVIRFHKNRPGEQWLSDDLDQYSEEALMVLTIPPRRVNRVIGLLEQEWQTPTGFFDQLTHGVFEPQGVERLENLLRTLPLGQPKSIDRRLVSLIWSMPTFMTWQAECVQAHGGDVRELKRAITKVHSLVKEILGEPF